MNRALRVAGWTLTVLCSAFATGTAWGQRRIAMYSDDQLHSAVAELRQTLSADPDLRGLKLRCGRFAAPNLPDANYDLGFERDFRKLAADFLAEQSAYWVRGEYDLVPGTLDNEGLQVIQLQLKLIGPARRECHTIVREINVTDDIVRILGLTIAPPDVEDVQVRNDAVSRAQLHQSVEVHDGTRVSAVGCPAYRVEVFRQTPESDEPAAVAPEVRAGQAFVQLRSGDTYTIKLHNFDTMCDACARVTIDGLDPIPAVAEKNSLSLGLLVPRAGTDGPGAHDVAGWLESITPERRVTPFRMQTYDAAAEPWMRPRSSRGIITVVFTEAQHPDEFPGRTRWHMKHGDALAPEGTSVPRLCHPIASSIVSLRFEREAP